jgi:hypothetical protein
MILWWGDKIFRKAVRDSYKEDMEKYLGQRI